VWNNGAEMLRPPTARDMGFSIIRQFRVPSKSVIYQLFQCNIDADEAIENLSWWESSSGTCLPNRIVKVQARKMGMAVHALVTPYDAKENMRRRVA